MIYMAGVYDTKVCVRVRFGLQAGVRHVVLAVSYRAELLQSEMKIQAERVSC